MIVEYPLTFAFCNYPAAALYENHLRDAVQSGSPAPNRTSESNMPPDETITVSGEVVSEVKGMNDAGSVATAEWSDDTMAGTLYSTMRFAGLTAKGEPMWLRGPKIVTLAAVRDWMRSLGVTHFSVTLHAAWDGVVETVEQAVLSI